MRNFLLFAGIAIPVIYLANLFGVGAMTAGFEHGSTLPSDLGRDGMANAALFNAGLFIVGVCGVLAALGLFLGLRAVSGGFILAALCALCMLAFGIAFLNYGLFPLPSAQHHALDVLGIAAMLAPLFGALALKGVDRWIVLAGFAAGLAMIALNAGIGGIANAGNIGWIIRVHSVVAFATFAYLCWATLKQAR